MGQYFVYAAGGLPYPYIYGKTRHRHSEYARGLAPLLTVMVYLPEASRVLSTPYPRHSKL